MCHVYARSTYLWVFLDYHPTVLNCLWFLWLMEADILLACENWRWPRKKKKKSNNWILRLLLLSLPFLLSKGLQMFTYLKQQTHWLGQQDNELFFFFGKMVDCCCKYSRERTCKNPSNISRALPMVCPHVVQFYGPFLLFLGYFVPELLPFDDWYIINPGCFVILLLSIAISVLYSSCVL